MGETALYHAARGVGSVARFGIWEAKSSSSYLREIRQILAVLGVLMGDTSHTLRQAPKELRIPTWELV